jgi:Ca2+-transporting ATPase
MAHQFNVMAEKPGFWEKPGFFHDREGENNIMAETSHKQLTGRFKGLTSAEIEASRQKYGSNILTPPERDPWWKLLLEKFDDPVIRILIIAAIIAIGVGIADGKYAEGIGIILAVALATTLAFLNEYKANKEFDILNQVNDEVPVKVIRDGHITTVPKKDLVVGDIALVELGEEIPADGQILEAVSFHVNEACLTGESLPVQKVSREEVAIQPIEETAYARDRLYRGTMVADGHGIMQISAVGDTTEVGKTARTAAEETEEETPLNIQLERLSKLIGVVGFTVAALIYIALVIRDIFTGELQLSLHQWYFVGVLKIAVIVALVRVWLPILYDGFELFGKELEAPDWLENDSLIAWAKTAGIGLGILLIGTFFGYLVGLTPGTSESWIPAEIGRNFLTYFMIAVTIIVVAVPEGLAMSVTLSLAYSMRKMTAANNLVRRMHACETIGAATVICSDKTGTLTLNQMQVHEVSFPCLGENSTLTKEQRTQGERLIIEAIAANTTAHLDRSSGTSVPLGNPTEGALLLWLENLGIDYVLQRDEFPVSYQWTFSTDRKYMATLGTSSSTNTRILHIKGAPEIILNHCTRILTPQGERAFREEEKAVIETQLHEYQQRGMRTLAFAYHDAPADHTEIEEITRDMIWLGFVAIADPIRPEVPEAIRICRNAGIKVTIVTGDNSETAKEIARQIHLWEENDTEDHHLTGREFEQLSDEEAEQVVTNLKVLSRARPLDKMRLVKLLQKRKQVVAVTGDGTNDAPALNYANVGLSMGKTGTSVAKEASDIVLLDDSFSSIVKGVMWGRSLYENIQRFILFQLTINVAALGIALLGPFIGVKIPLTVTQMLWVNLIMDTFAALALATEPPHWDVMKRPPRDPHDFILTKAMTKNILTVASAFLIFFVGLLIYIQRDGVVSTHELTIFFTIFVMCQFWNMFNARCLSLTHSAFDHLMENKGFVVIASAIFIGQIFIIQVGGTAFRTVPLALQEWVLIILGTSVVLWAGEGWRWMQRKKNEK